MSPDTLRALIEASGLSQVEWARTVVGRDSRTVRRWLAGDVIPDSVVDWLARIGPVLVSATSVAIRVSR